MSNNLILNINKLLRSTIVGVVKVVHIVACQDIIVKSFIFTSSELLQLTN